MKVIFVCTGNTCRSPMAEGILKKLLKEDGLSTQIMCQSAGLSALEGTPVSEKAVAVCAEINVDISGYKSRRLTGEEIDGWDIYFTMSETHGYILERAGVLHQKIYIPHYIEDPFGQDIEGYRTCRMKLEQEVAEFYDLLKQRFAARINADNWVREAE